MRLLMAVSVVLLALALVAVLVPTQIAGQGPQTWLIAGLFFWALDVLLGENLAGRFTYPAHRQNPPA